MIRTTIFIQIALMKKLCLSLLLAAFSAMGLAQVNLREGIVITLEGDTLHGSIDFRTDKLNAEQCYFIQDGQQDVVVYHPQEIAGYRFLDNGRYYVSKTVMDQKSGVEKTLFMEYILRGQVSLYRVNDDDYYLQNSDGELGLFHPIAPKQRTAERRRNLKWALYYTRDSKSTQRKLWDDCTDEDHITSTIYNYNQEVCPNGDCEVYQYRAKKRPKADRSLFPKIMVGYEDGRVKERYIDYLENYSVPVITVGVDYFLKRLSKGLFVEANLSYRRYEYSCLKLNDFTLFLGTGYQLKQCPLQPRLYLGYIPSVNRYKDGRVYYLYGKEKESVTRILGHGFQVGTGVTCPLSHGALLLNFNFSGMHSAFFLNDNENDFIGCKYYLKMRRLAFSLGYQF